MSHFHCGGHNVISYKKCCYLVSEHKVSVQHLCSSVHQFLIYSIFVLFLKEEHSVIIGFFDIWPFA